MNVRTRFAPSPTGVLHIGSVRTALFCWLFARRHGGQFILRIEDTDRERSTDENVHAILDGMQWLGLEADEGPLYQTRRFDRYAEVAADWVERGLAYRCYCSRERLDALRAEQLEKGLKTRYDGRCRDRTEPVPGVEPVIRFRNPDEGAVLIQDVVRGEVRIDNSELDDLIIVRSDGTPTYNFTVVVDDYDMGITHVIRGDDHLNNTPRQINMFRALDAEPPVFAHLPMIHGDDGSKLSKRHGAVDVREFREQGYLPEALLNYLVRLGWSHGDREIFTVDEMIALFDLPDVNASPSVFNPQKLRWVNQQHIMSADAADLAGALEPHFAALGVDPGNGPPLEDAVEAFRERSETLVEMAEGARYAYVDEVSVDPRAAKKHLRPVVLEPLTAVAERLKGMAEWTPEDISATVAAVAADFEIGLGKLGQPLRVAVTGTGASPSLDVTLALAGKDRTVSRINTALDYIRARAEQQG